MFCQKKRCCQKLCKIHRKKPVLESLSNKFADLGISFLIELQAGNLKLAADALSNKLVIKILQISQERTCVGVSF